MKIPSQILTAVPRLPHVQREIAKAILTLTAQDEDERALARGREHSAALRNESDTPPNELELIKRYFRDNFLRELAAELRRAGFSPNQPRVPAGNDNGGQWTSDGGITEGPNAPNENDSIVHPEARNVHPFQIMPVGFRCDGISGGCQSGGTYGTTGMYGIQGRVLCIDCAVKMLGIQDEPSGEKTKTLDRYIIGR